MRLPKFHLILTLDYELFGDGSGCIDPCLIRPTDQCAEILQQFDGHMTLFVEALEFARMRELATEGHVAVESQIKKFIRSGHEIALHLHPQWPRATFEHGAWNLALDKWRIGDLNPSEAQEVVKAGLHYLSTLSDADVQVFRAGGWAIQPESDILAALAKENIVIDSTVAPGAVNWAKGDWYNFSKSPKQPWWPISNNVTQEDVYGPMLEVPIATHRIGIASHIRALLERRRKPGFPEGCHGSYAGPNGPFDNFLGKLSKVLQLGHVMLDFSSLPAPLLIQTINGIRNRYAQTHGPIPIVAIGHNKNFTNDSASGLKDLMNWVSTQDEIVLSSYAEWHNALLAHNRRDSA